MLLVVALNLGAAVVAVAALTTAMRLATRLVGEDGRDDRGWAVRAVPTRPRPPRGGLGRRPAHTPAQRGFASRAGGRRGPATEGGPAARSRVCGGRLARRA